MKKSPIFESCLLSDLKRSPNAEVEQLLSEFQGLRTSLQQQQEDVIVSLRNLGLQDVTMEEIADHSEPINTNKELHVSTEGDDKEYARADEKAKEIDM